MVTYCDFFFRRCFYCRSHSHSLLVGISRNWKDRKYVQNVSLVIIDEIHLLGADRGPILEVIVSRMRYISEKLGKSIRIVGLSTALANSKDLADWLGIDRVGHYNFRPRVRPVPLEVRICFDFFATSSHTLS
jgi:activating signal cointegrator complex subunit 3